jgi:hypothetical protein
MTYVLQKDSPLTIEKLERQTKEERRKTLGYFLAQLRGRAALDSDFDSLLEKFLEERNHLVHDVSAIPGWALHTTEGRKIARSFLDGFIHKTLEVQKVFLGVARAWQEEANIDVPFPCEHELFAEIDANKARVDDLLFEEDS